MESIQTRLHFLCLLKSKTIFSLKVIWQFRYSSISLELCISKFSAYIITHSKSKIADSDLYEFFITSWGKWRSYSYWKITNFTRILMIAIKSDGSLVIVCYEMKRSVRNEWSNLKCSKGIKNKNSYEKQIFILFHS